jgi:hypothetical protein
MAAPSGTGAYPASERSVYLLPATPYTAWYLQLHVYEFNTLIYRAQTTLPRGLAHHAAKVIWNRHGLSGEPDYSKPIPFTPIDDRIFHTIRVTETDAAGLPVYGRFGRTILPADPLANHHLIHRLHP